MEMNCIPSGSSCLVELSGHFTFSDHTAFKEVRNICTDDNYDSVIIDFSSIEFMDSSALGMLMIAREEAEKHKKSLLLRKPVGQVEKMFRVSKFESLFNIEF